MTQSSSLLRRTFRPTEFTGWHMLGVICLFFGTIITVNLTLAFNAATTWTGLMVPNTYVESQNFNDRLAEADARSKLGWSAELLTSDTGLSVRLNDAAGAEVSNATLTGRLGRPVQEGEDQTIAFARGEDGARLWRGKLAPGLWRIQLIAQEGETRWMKTVRFTVANRAKVN
ncbi:MAG: FixH family protein [Pseudomonadota bacterium]